MISSRINSFKFKSLILISVVTTLQEPWVRVKEEEDVCPTNLSGNWPTLLLTKLTHQRVVNTAISYFHQNHEPVKSKSAQSNLTPPFLAVITSRNIGDEVLKNEAF